MHKEAGALRSLRNLYSIKAILEMEKKVIVCPFPFHSHVNHTPSFGVFTDRGGYEAWSCFGCDRKGDVIDLIGYMSIGVQYNPHSPGDVSKAIEMLIKGYKLSPPEDIASRPRPKTLSYDLWKAFPLGDRVIEYAKARGLTAETLQAYGIGEANYEVLKDAISSSGGKADWVRPEDLWMTLPTFHHGKLMGIKMRNINATGKRNRFISFPGSQAGLFGMTNVFNTSSPIVIAKGEISTMNLWQRGIQHVAAPNCGEGMVDLKWGVWTNWSERAIIIGDNDPEEIKSKLSKAYAKRCETFRAKLYFPPNKYHDVDNWLLDDPGAINEIQGWLM